MKVIGVSGAQGGGKTTLLAEIKNLGYAVDDFKVSRAVQEELGWESLSQVTTSIDTMIDFQTKVLEAKANNDRRLKQEGDGVILVERTFADIYAYTCLWIKKLSEGNQKALFEGTEFMTLYSAKCLAYQEEIYDGVVLLPFMSHIAWVDDPKRASREDIDEVFMSVGSFALFTSVPFMKIKTLSPADRAFEVTDFIRRLK